MRREDGHVQGRRESHLWRVPPWSCSALRLWPPPAAPGGPPASPARSCTSHPRHTHVTPTSHPRHTH
eukprot:3794398-Pyramimonas_sp.AAC.1